MHCLLNVILVETSKIGLLKGCNFVILSSSVRFIELNLGLQRGLFWSWVIRLVELIYFIDLVLTNIGQTKKKFTEKSSKKDV